MNFLNQLRSRFRFVGGTTPGDVNGRPGYWQVGEYLSAPPIVIGPPRKDDSSKIGQYHNVFVDAPNKAKLPSPPFDTSDQPFGPKISKPGHSMKFTRQCQKRFLVVGLPIAGEIMINGRKYGGAWYVGVYNTPEIKDMKKKGWSVTIFIKKGSKKFAFIPVSILSGYDGRCI